MVKKMTKKEAVDKIKNWRNEAKSAKGKAIGVRNDSATLYNYGLGHEKRSRSADRGGKRKFSGMGGYIEPIMRIFQGGLDKEITNQEFRLLRNAVSQGKISDTSSNNPRNVVNSYPDPSNPSKKKTQYGHWWSLNYIAGMKAKDKDYKVPPFPKVSTWASENQGQAKPPLWQLFFAKRGKKTKAKVMSIGLFPLLEEILQGLEGDHLELVISRSSLEKTKTYEQLVDIKSLRKRLNQLLNTSNVWANTKSTNAEGKEIAVVRIKPRDFQRLLEGKFTLTGAEENTIKTLAGKKDAAGGVKEFSLPTLSPTQLERLLLAAHGPNAQVKGTPVQWFNLWRSAPQTAKNRDLQKMYWRDYLQVV